MKQVELRQGETVVRQGKANHWVRGAGADGGLLTLTSQRLLFRPHAMNFARLPVTLELRDVDLAVARNPLNGLTVVLRDGSLQKFVVWQRKAWIDVINRAAGSRERF